MAQAGSLVTGEAVALDLRLAALPSRLLARAVDGLAQLALLLLAVALSAVTGVDGSDAAVAALTVTVLVLVLVGYPVAFETLLRGRTPGKAALGLRVVRDDGGPITFWQALVRGLAGLVDLVTVFCVSVVVMLLHPLSKRLGDLAAGTVVVQERVASRGAPVVAMPPPLARWAQGLELSRLPDGLALSTRAFLARSGDLTDDAREDLGRRLVAAVGQVTAPAPPAGTPGWAYLSAVLAERRRREELRLAPARPGGRAGDDDRAHGRQHGQPARGAPPAAATPAPVPDTPGGFVLPS